MKYKRISIILSQHYRFIKYFQKLYFISLSQNLVKSSLNLNKQKENWKKEGIMSDSSEEYPCSL